MQRRPMSLLVRRRQMLLLDVCSRLHHHRAESTESLPQTFRARANVPSGARRVPHPAVEGRHPSRSCRRHRYTIQCRVDDCHLLDYCSRQQGQYFYCHCLVAIETHSDEETVSPVDECRAMMVLVDIPRVDNVDLWMVMWMIDHRHWIVGMIPSLRRHRLRREQHRASVWSVAEA